MRLIILHHYSDGYTYSGTATIPVERESEEALIVELEDWGRNKEPDCHGWCNTGIEPNTALGKSDYCSIEIMTLEKWWEDNCK